MHFSPHFLVLRLRHASPAELFCRMKQTISLILIKIWINMGGGLRPKQKPDRMMIDNLQFPELMIETICPSGEGPIRAVPEPDAARTDIRLRWEPARLQEAMALMVSAHRKTDRLSRAEAESKAASMILEWIRANPFPHGEHYQSAMECALRIPVFMTALKQVDRLDADEYDLILDAIYQHAWLISNKLSLYSSLGNHTIVEAVGLIFAGAAYRHVGTGRRWLATGVTLLGSELPHQILSDGGPAEQSLSYHRFVLDLCWLSADFLKRNNLGDILSWRSKLLSGECFLNAFKGQDGRFPAIGDSDDGYAIAPGVSPARESSIALKVPWVTFKETGYSILNDGNIVFTFDHGPLGMAPFYNHGHADALSITLSKNGRPLLVDPGTYRYNNVSAWRNYFKGTRAHNTVTIDGEDQAVQETSFIWSNPYRCELVDFKNESGDLYYSAFHDGYTRLKKPVRHQRSILFFDQGNFIIKDRFSGEGDHCFQINYHLHPDVETDNDGIWWTLRSGGERIYMRLIEGDPIAVNGQKDPLLGWYSSRYGGKMPTHTLTFSQTGNVETVTFTTVICTKTMVDFKNGLVDAEKLERSFENS